MDMYKDTGEQACAVCKGKGVRTVWQGSIHEPQDHIDIKCDHCKGRGWVIVVDNPH